MPRKIDRTGEEKQMNNGVVAKVVEYNNARDIIVEFQDEYKFRTKAEYGNFKKGTISNPYAKTVYGVGFIGVGEHYVYSSSKGGHNKIYKCWVRLLERCYSEKFQNNNKSYVGCTVDEKWHNFQEFATWHVNNYIDGFEIDKDILAIGNKIYSERTCRFIPKWLNSFMTNNSYSNKCGATGVFINSKNGKYRAECSMFLSNKGKYLGEFNTIEEASQAYAKERAKNVELAIKKAIEEGVSDEIISKIK